MWQAIKCFFGFHPQKQTEPYGSIMLHDGPAFVYHCKECKRVFYEPWN
jgi:hypothetical protein